MRLLAAALFLLSLPVLAIPPAPEGAEDGDIVEIDGEMYEVWDGELVPLDVEEPTPVEDTADPELDVPDEGGFVIEDTVTGSRVQQGASGAVRTDVVDKATIEEAGARTLSDALQRVGGLQVSNSSTGLGDGVSIDGLSGKYVKILVDGRPVNGTVNGSVDVGRLPVSLADIERIEVVRGPMSALYGSEAMGGVVNIITGRPKPNLGADVELSTRLDGQGLQRTSFAARVNGGNELMALKLTLSALQDDARDRAFRYDREENTEFITRFLGRAPEKGEVVQLPNGIFDLPHKRQLTSSLDASLYPNEDWALRVYGTATLSEIENRLAPNLPLRDHTADTQFQLGVVAEGDLAPLHTLKIDTRIDRFVHRFEKLPDAGQTNIPPFCRHDLGGTFIDTPCPAPARVSNISTQDQTYSEVIYTGVLAQEAPWARELKLASGAVLRFDEISRVNGAGEDTIPGGGQRLLTAAYGELAWQINAGVALVPSARFENVLDLQDNAWVAIPAFTPKLSARFDLPAGFALRASFGNGFRVPDFLERYLRFDHSDLGYIVEGNPDIAPESSTGFRAEALYEGGGVNLGVEGFLNLTDNMIATLPTGGFGGDGAGGDVPVFSYVNLARAYTSGLNFRAGVSDVAGFGFDVSYQYLINAVNSSGCPETNPWFCSGEEGALSLASRPYHSGHIGLRYALRATDTSLFTQADFQTGYQALIGLASSDASFVTEEDLRSVSGFFNWRVGLKQPVGEKAEVLLTLDNLLDHYDPLFGPKPGRTVLVTLRAGL
jgi:outer membrane receptor for ferrienterochelin and colicins